MCGEDSKEIDFTYYNKCIEEHNKKQEKIIEGFNLDSEDVLLKLKNITKELYCSLKNKTQ